MKIYRLLYVWSDRSEASTLVLELLPPVLFILLPVVALVFPTVELAGPVELLVLPIADEVLPLVAVAPPSMLPPEDEVLAPVEALLFPVVACAPPSVLPPLVAELGPVVLVFVAVVVFPSERLVVFPPVIVPLVLPPLIMPVVVLVEFWVTRASLVGLMVTPDAFEAEDVPLWLLVLMVPVAEEGVVVSPIVCWVIEHDVEFGGHCGGVCAAAGAPSAKTLASTETPIQSDPPLMLFTIMLLLFPDKH